MNDFNPHAFTTGAFLTTLGATSFVASLISAPAAIIDRRRLIDHELMRERTARARAAALTRLVHASLASAAASHQLRRAALQVGALKR